MLSMPRLALGHEQVLLTSEYRRNVRTECTLPDSVVGLVMLAEYVRLSVCECVQQCPLRLDLLRKSAWNGLFGESRLWISAIPRLDKPRGLT
jgi:hypothetical protein